GERADGGPEALRQAAQGEEQLVLLGLDAGLARGLLAEGEELAQLVAEGREQAVALGGERCRVRRDGGAGSPPAGAAAGSAALGSRAGHGLEACCRVAHAVASSFGVV